MSLRFDTGPLGVLEKHERLGGNSNRKSHVVRHSIVSMFKGAMKVSLLETTCVRALPVTLSASGSVPECHWPRKPRCQGAIPFSTRIYASGLSRLWVHAT